ncbi:MAG: hypothetical protein ACRDYA_15580 [Egibacteraceae bacterium]
MQIHASQIAYLRRRQEEIPPSAPAGRLRGSTRTHSALLLSAAEARDYGLVDEVASAAEVCNLHLERYSFLSLKG